MTAVYSINGQPVQPSTTTIKTSSTSTMNTSGKSLGNVRIEPLIIATIGLAIVLVILLMALTIKHKNKARREEERERNSETATDPGSMCANKSSAVKDTMVCKKPTPTSKPPPMTKSA